MTTPSSDHPWDDLPEWEARLSRSVANFLEGMESYDTYGRELKGEVVERLRRLAEQRGYFPKDSVQAAVQLEAALDHFSVVQFRLSNKMTLIRLAVRMVGDTLPMSFMRSILDAARRDPTDLTDAAEQSAQAVSDIARIVLALAIGAFDEATKVLVLRVDFLARFLEATDSPRSVPGIHDEALRKIVEEAAANEVLLAAGEVALDRLPLEWARHMPFATIVASLASFALDVRKEVKSLEEKRALWKQLLDAPYRRNVGDEAREGAVRILEDDEAIDRLLESLNATVQKLRELAKAL